MSHRILRAAKSLVRNPGKIFLYLNSAHLLDRLDDETCLKLIWKARFGTDLDLSHPTSFNEKMQWLKLYNRDPLYTRMADKITAKEIVSGLIGQEYVIPTIAVWSNPEQIDYPSLPECFVLKCNHTSGEGLILCRDKTHLNIRRTNASLRRALQHDYSLVYREWPYRDIPRRILAEPYVEDQKAADLGLDTLPVYKFLCFEGEPKIIQTIQNDKMPNESIDYFDPSWNRLEMRQNYPNSLIPSEKPDRLEEMLEIARTLSAGFHFLRVDLYQVNGRILFSEFTFFSDAGFAPFFPEEWNQKLGEWIQI